MKNTPARVLAGSHLTEEQTHHIFETNTLGISEPEAVARDIRALLRDYYGTTGQKSLDDILGFHHRFERIHPFQDSNGCVGRLLLFKECVCHHHVPFIIADALKTFYYRGLQQWHHIREYLRDTCLTAQDFYRLKLRQLRIPHCVISPAAPHDASLSTTTAAAAAI